MRPFHWIRRLQSHVSHRPHRDSARQARRIHREPLYLAALMAAGLCFTRPLLAQKGTKPGGGGSPSYTIVKLNTAGGAHVNGSAFDINDLGHVVGQVHDPASSPRAIAAFWAVNGQDSTVRPLIGGVSANAINNLNEIVGAAVDQDNVIQGAYWAAPTAKPIALPPLKGGIGSHGLDINDDGVICGYSLHVVAGNDGLLRPADFACVWRVVLSDGQVSLFGPVPLPLLDEVSIANAISETDADGFATIVGGYAKLNGPETAAVRWAVQVQADGTLMTAVKPQLLETGEAVALGVNNIGMTCGRSRLSPKTPTDARAWADGLGVTLDPNREHHAEALDANDSGAIVGVGGPNVADLEAYVWPSATSRPVLLNKFLPKRNSPFSYLKEANAINQAGVIVGTGWGTTKSFLPFLAIPK